MPKLALLANLQAKPGKAAEVARFLADALPLAQAEAGTTSWFALQLGPELFGIFDTFDAESGRRGHLDGPIAAALMDRASDLLAQPPSIQKVDILAAKFPH